MNIYLVRHGQDDEEYRGGWSNLPLIDSGIKQCKLLAKYLKEKQDEYRIDKILSSDLVRAKQTADIINEQLNIPIEYVQDLREINNGKLAGMLNETAKIEFPGLYFNTLEMDERYPNGESPLEFLERVKKYFYNLLDEYNKNDSIMLVTHGGVIKIICCIVENIEWTNKIKVSPVDNAALYRVVIDENKNMKLSYLKC